MCISSLALTLQSRNEAIISDSGTAIDGIDIMHNVGHRHWLGIRKPQWLAADSVHMNCALFLV